MKVPGQRGGLVRDALHHVAVGGDHPGAVVEDVEPVTVVAAGAHPLAQGHADGVGHALPEGPRRGVDAGDVVVFGMARRA